MFLTANRSGRNDEKMCSVTHLQHLLLPRLFASVERFALASVLSSVLLVRSMSSCFPLFHCRLRTSSHGRCELFSGLFFLRRRYEGKSVRRSKQRKCARRKMREVANSTGRRQASGTCKRWLNVRQTSAPLLQWQRTACQVTVG